MQGSPLGLGDGENGRICNVQDRRGDTKVDFGRQRGCRYDECVRKIMLTGHGVDSVRHAAGLGWWDILLTGHMVWMIWQNIRLGCSVGKVLSHFVGSCCIWLTGWMVQMILRDTGLGRSVSRVLSHSARGRCCR